MSWCEQVISLPSFPSSVMEAGQMWARGTRHGGLPSLSKSLSGTDGCLGNGCAPSPQARQRGEDWLLSSVLPCFQHTHPFM